MSTRDEWLAWRRSGIGASDVAGILGVSPWASPWSVWADKVGLGDNDTDSEAMEFGRRAEVMIGPWFHDLTGLHLVGEQTWCAHPDHPWRRATVDGFVADHHELATPGDALSVGEIKTTSDPPKHWEDDGIPLHYQCQAAWAAHVTGIPSVDFIVLHLAFGRPQLRIYEHTPDPVDVATWVHAVDRFWHDHVVAGIAPPADDHPATADALNNAWTTTQPEPPVNADDLDATIRELDAVRRHIKANETRKAALENEIKARLADHTELHVGGDLAVSWRPQERTGIDAKAVRAAHGDTYDTHKTIRVMRTHLTETNHTKEHTHP